MCSIRWRMPGAAPAAGRRRAHSARPDRRWRASRTGSRPVRTAPPPGRSARDRATAAPGRALAVGLLEPGGAGLDDAVDEELRHAATPALAPFVAQPRPALELVARASPARRGAEHDAHAELAARLELAQLVEASRAIRPCAQTAVRPVAVICLSISARRSRRCLVRRLRHDALDQPDGARLEQDTRRATVAADDLRAALELARAVDARRGERCGRRQRRVEVEEREQGRCAADRVGDERTVQLDAVERRVLERMPPHPLRPARNARARRPAQRAPRPPSRGPRGRRRRVSSAPISGCWCASTSPGTSASPRPSIVSVRASQAARTAASSPTATIIPSRSATAVAHGWAGSSVRIRAPNTARSAELRTTASLPAPLRRWRRQRAPGARRSPSPSRRG